ncbi:zinc finger, CCHC-type containing protein [Tanacetum coccineum]
MIQVKEMMQDNDLKNSKSKDKGSRSRSQSMNDQSHYKQDKTKTRQSINVKNHILNVIGGTEECEERDLNIGGDWNNVVPLRSDTIWLVQNGCSFHGLQSEDPNQHLKDFLKLVDSLDLRDQASNWLERLPVGSITTWKDLTTRFLAQFFPSGRTVKLRNDILMFQQHQGESLSEVWARFKDLLQKFPHHGIDLWL